MVTSTYFTETKKRLLLLDLELQKSQKGGSWILFGVVTHALMGTVSIPVLHPHSLFSLCVWTAHGTEEPCSLHSTKAAGMERLKKPNWLREKMDWIFPDYTCPAKKVSRLL